MAIEYENTPVEWQNQGTEPSEDLKKNGFQAGYKPPAQVFNYLQNNISSCLNELQTKLNELSNAVNELPGDIGDVGETVEQMQTDITNINSSIDQLQTDLTTLDGNAIKGIKGNGTTIRPSSTGIINITPNNIGAAASTHYHSATQITSGTLSIERGGTGSATAEEVRENLGLAATDLSNVDNEVFTNKATSAGIASGTVLYDNPSGATGNITLLSDINDYKYVEVYYKKSSGVCQYLPSTDPLTTLEPEIISVPDCVGVAKTSVPKNGATYIDIDYCVYELTENINVENGTTGNATYHNERTTKTVITTNKTTASITNKTFSYNTVYIKDTYTKNYYRFYRNVSRNGVLEYDDVGGSSKSETRTTDILVGDIGAPIYAIVGYK